jgi:ABC-type nitrate/sulfonate/bicarbonate transport system permease component
MSRPTSRPIAGALVGAALAAGIWESFARSGLFSPALTPSVIDILRSLAGMIASGALAVHVLATLGRILIGLAGSFLVGVPLGMLMGRFRPVERFFLPLVSVLSPIPSLAWVPLFILWFGLGNAAAIGLVVYAAIFPLVLNTWTGVRSVNRLWLRAAEAMGADPRTLFLKVVLPGALPFIIAGFRQAFARGWIAGRRRDDRCDDPGPRLRDLRRQGIPQRRHHDGLPPRHRSPRSRLRAPRVPDHRAPVRRPLGHGPHGARLTGP